MIQAEWTRGVRKDIQITVNGTAVTDEITALTYTDDINGDGSAVKIGSTCAAGVEFTVAAPSVSYAGAVLTISIAGVPLGVFTVTGARMMDGRLAVTAADAMAGGAMQDYFEPTAASGTALGVIREIASGAGLQLADVSGISDVSVTGLSVGCTRREMLGRMAAVLGRNAHIDRYGKLCLRWYENSGGAVGPGDIYAGGIEKAEADYEIEKIECSVTTVTETTEDDTTTEQTQTVVLEAGTGTMGISLDCPYMTQAILDGIYRRIGGFSFRPMNLTIYGDCRIETGDILTVTDPDNVVYTVPVMAVTHTWDGGVKTVIKASGEIAAEGNGQLRGTLGQAVARLEAELARFRNLEAENITVLRGRISQLFADWAHIGEAIIDTLEAEGINADWINAGAFVVKDSNGNILIDADAEHQQVRIGGLNVFPSALSGAVDACEIGLQNGKFQTWQTGNVLHYVALEAAKLRFYYYQNGQQYDYGALQISDDGGSKYTVSSSGAITTTLFWDQVLNLLSKTLLTITGPVTFEDMPAFEKGFVSLATSVIQGSLRCISPNITDGETPSSNAWGAGFSGRDSSGGKIIMQVQPVDYASGAKVLYLSRTATYSGTEKTHTLRIGFDANGNSKVWLAQSAWLEALDLDIVSITPFSGLSSGYTLKTGSNVYKQGNHVFGDLVVQCSTALGTAQATIGTLTYKPLGTINSYCGLSTNEWTVNRSGYFYINSSTGVVTVRDSTGGATFIKIHLDYVTG